MSEVARFLAIAVMFFSIFGMLSVWSYSDAQVQIAKYQSSCEGAK